MKKMMEYYPSASAYLNEKFMLIIARYGCHGGGYDYSVPRYFFTADTDDKVSIGRAVLSTLKSSRPVSLDEFDDIYRLNLLGEQYNKLFSIAMKKFEYKSKRSLFMKMRLVHIELLGQNIKICPNKYVRLQAWEGLSAENLIIPFLSEPIEVASALCLAFDRCKWLPI